MITASLNLLFFRIKGFDIQGDEVSPIIHLHLKDTDEFTRAEIEAKLDQYVDKVSYVRFHQNRSTRD